MILHYGDLTDASSLVRLVTEVCNDHGLRAEGTILLPL